MSIQKIQVKKADILAMREKGMTQADLANHYGVSQTEVKRLLLALNITGRPKQKPVFEVIEDETTPADDKQLDMFQQPNVVVNVEVVTEQEQEGTNEPIIEIPAIASTLNVNNIPF